jgi:hypothetical protein
VKLFIHALVEHSCTFPGLWPNPAH